MSLNIQTSTGLLEIGGNVTKEKVISALGYEPADKAHVEDTDVHVSTEDRQTWNNKSDFSGAYADLLDAPNITENDSDSMVIADESGNIIMQVDADGVSTTNVNTKTVKLNGKDLGERLDELEANMVSNIVEDESGKVEFTDESGNVIARIGVDGFETTTVTAKSAIIGGVDITAKLDEHKESIDDATNHIADTDIHITATERETWATSIDQNTEDISGLNTTLSSHTTDTTAHITADERTLWNNKSDFSGDYNDLTNAPDIKEDSSGEVVYADESGNIIAKIDANGLETTTVTAKNVVVNGTDVEEKLNSIKETFYITVDKNGVCDKSLNEIIRSLDNQKGRHVEVVRSIEKVHNSLVFNLLFHYKFAYLDIEDAMPVVVFFAVIDHVSSECRLYANVSEDDPNELDLNRPALAKFVDVPIKEFVINVDENGICDKTLDEINTFATNNPEAPMMVARKVKKTPQAGLTITTDMMYMYTGVVDVSVDVDSGSLVPTLAFSCTENGIVYSCKLGIDPELGADAPAVAIFDDGINIKTLCDAYLPLEGGTLSGSIDLTYGSVSAPGITAKSTLNIKDAASGDTMIISYFPNDGSGVSFQSNLNGYGKLTIGEPEEDSHAATKKYVDSLGDSKQNIMTHDSRSGIIDTTILNETEYEFTDVTSLTMTGACVECHGFITFAASAPTVSVSGFTASAGDDITAAAASEVWEFSVYAHSSKSYIIWKNWSA